MFNWLKVGEDTVFDLLQRLFEGGLKAVSTPTRRQRFVIIESVDQVTAELGQKNQFATHALCAFTSIQYCSCERALDGFCS
jgi:hypothetical protein